jgi:phosphoserine phosphatase SerB
MVSIIIPILNESETIGKVIDFCKKSPLVAEIIVVDDKSTDNSVKIALNKEVTVITSTKLGKGASMRDGLLCATQDIIVFLDGDIDPYPDSMIENLTRPIIESEADFVKATFNRQAGRVTELVAKPLLSLLIPDLSKFSQPLSGMIAGKRSLFKNIDFQDDYGVDIGILIDMYNLKANILEVNIGSIENKMQQWQQLGKMSREVSRTIIKKTLSLNPTRFNLEDMETVQIIRGQMEAVIEEELEGLKKIAFFDMDNTILKGRFIDTCAKTYNFEDKLEYIRLKYQDPLVLSKQIAALLKGLDIAQLIAVIDSIPLIPDTLDVVKKLKSKGYIVGIISDSYDFATTHIKNKIGADFCLSNELEFSRSIATGEVKIPSFFFTHETSTCKHTVCKTNAVLHFIQPFNISLNNCIAVGDSANDICMIQNVGVGFAFCTQNSILKYTADFNLEKPSFRPILKHA